jgi:hypothetical protein
LGEISEFLQGIYLLSFSLCDIFIIVNLLEYKLHFRINFCSFDSIYVLCLYIHFRYTFVNSIKKDSFASGVLFFIFTFVTIRNYEKPNYWLSWEYEDNQRKSIIDRDFILVSIVYSFRETQKVLKRSFLRILACSRPK